MGYSYGINVFTGKQNLCCDRCDRSRYDTATNDITVKKYMMCPFGWCKKVALCSNCYPEYKNRDMREIHKTCKEMADNYEEKLRAEHKLLLDGHFLRNCALLHDNPKRVKVIFKGMLGRKAYFMNEATYDALPLSKVTTIEDYQKIGNIEEAESLDIYENH